MNRFPDLFIVGTDTGVGKTMVALLLMQLAYNRGCVPFYLKPFQTGCVNIHDRDSDANFVYTHTGALKRQDPEQSVIYCNTRPKAPYFAAGDDDQIIDLDRVLHVIAEKRKRYSPVIVEAAGGLLVPVTDNKMVIDVVKESGCRPLLVARTGLGTINHTLLSIESLRQKQLEPVGVVFVQNSPLKNETDLLAENIAAVEQFGRIKVGGVVAYISDFHHPPETNYKVFDRLLHAEE